VDHLTPNEGSRVQIPSAHKSSTWNPVEPRKSSRTEGIEPPIIAPVDIPA
jgi:hypothetical protein